ncbi:MAG: hypothetical protein WDN31_17420 [Hyphomicrobium sp.]
MPSPAAAPGPAIAFSHTLATLGTWLAVWLVPLALVALVFGSEHVLSQLACSSPSSPW